MATLSLADVVFASCAVEFVEVKYPRYAVACVIFMTDGGAFVGYSSVEEPATSAVEDLRCAAFKRAEAQVILHLEAVAAQGRAAAAAVIPRAA